MFLSIFKFEGRFTNQIKIKQNLTGRLSETQNSFTFLYSLGALNCVYVNIN